MRFLLTFAAVVLFVLAAVAAIWPADLSVNVDGFVAFGLAALAASLLPFPSVPSQ